MRELALLSKHLETLLPQLGTEDFPRGLADLLMALVPCEDATILLYAGAELPTVEYSREADEGGSSTLDTFTRGAFLLDPFYHTATRDKRFGVFRLRDLAPSGFRDSEYYRSWYRNCGYQDECGFLVALSHGGFVNIALGKTRPRATFSKKQLQLFEAVRPAIEALCREHWADAGAVFDGDLRGQLNAALEGFGSSLLTEREAQVINLVLHGHSTKTLADKLSISVETVKLHRKHAYAKLEVSSQAELFYLFLDSVMSARDYRGGDTLAQYMDRRAAAAADTPTDTPPKG